MIRIILIFISLVWLAPAQARPLYSSGFEPPSIAPLFPLVGGDYQLPPGPAADRLRWLVDELAVGETTTVAEVNANFDPAWLAQISVADTQAFIASLRASFPDAVIRDVVGVTPIRSTVVIDSPAGAPPHGFVNMAVRYTGTRRITTLGVSNYNGTVQYPADQVLTLAQAADKFATLSSAPSLLVGRIGAGGQCTALADRNAAVPRATASIFKIYVLGGVGRMIADGPLSAATPIPLIASEVVPGAAINIEPLGTPFPAGDLATLMMGISDNTATDLLLAWAGRPRMNQAVIELGAAQPTLLTPLLGVGEQFHVFRSFPLAEALSYVNGTEPFQEQFVVDRIEPLGPITSYPFFHVDLMTSGTWMASPMDICAAFAALRRLPQGSEALATVDAALGSQAAQPEVRGDFDRVWYKGGSLAQVAGSFHVLTHAWMLEDAGRDPFVVVAMSNSNTGGIDQFAVQSITGRMLELVSQLP
jgi:hypothetical protein